MATAVPFQRQPLEAPLSDKAKDDLKALARKRIEDYGLQKRVKLAIEFLTEGVEPLINAAHEEHKRYDKKVERLAADDEEEEDEEREKHNKFQADVKELTHSMDMGIRAAIDHQVWLEDLPDSLKNVSNTAAQVQPSQRSQRTTQRSSLVPTQDQTPRPRPFDPDADDDDDGGNEDENENPDETMQGDEDEDEDEDVAPPPEQTPSALLHAALSTQKRKWDAMTPTEKYAHHNDFAGFYTTRFDALNPGPNAPPMPAASIWFAAEEGKQLSATQNAQGDDDDADSDIEIAAERISIKCPITLLPFQDPVTSKKCKHSFERQAIMNMLRTTAASGLTDGQEAEVNAIRGPGERRLRRQELLNERQRGVKCPECRQFLEQSDLEPNPLLKRRAMREIEALRQRDEADRADEDDSDEDDVPRGTQRRPMGLESSPAPGISRRGSSQSVMKTKRESVSGRVPDSQRPPTGTQRSYHDSMVVDLDDDDEDELA